MICFWPLHANVWLCQENRKNMVKTLRSRHSPPSTSFYTCHLAHHLIVNSPSLWLTLVIGYLLCLRPWLVDISFHRPSFVLNGPGTNRWNICLSMKHHNPFRKLKLHHPSKSTLLKYSINAKNNILVLSNLCFIFEN